MKIISALTTVCLSLLTQHAMAQYKTGMITVGGSTSGSANYRDGYEDDTRLILSPSMGYYYNDQAGVGITASFEHFGMFSSTSYTISPFWRYNTALTERAGLYGILTPTVGRYVSDGSTGKYESWNAGIGGGFGGYWFPTARLSLDLNLANLSYIHGRTYENDVLSTKSNRVAFNLETTSLALSLYYHFAGG